MKKVVIFYKSYQKYGGQEKVIWNFSHYLAENDYLVDVYTAKVKDLSENKNITLKKIFIPPLPRGLRTLLFALLSYKKAEKIKKNHSNICIFGFGKTFYQDIYRSGGGVHKYYFQRALFKYSNITQRKLYKIKKYLSMSHWINIVIEKLTFENNSLKSIIVPSEFVKKQIMDTFQVNESKIKVIRNGVDLSKYPSKTKEKQLQSKDKLSIPPELPAFAFISTNHRLKGLDFLLEACAILKDKKFILIVAGSGDEKYFMSRINKLGIENKVLWAGKTDKVSEIYTASDALLYPTLFDASSNVVLESMACATLVVSSIYNGTSELIKENQNGFLLNDPADSQDIADKMLYVINHIDKSRKMGKNARKTIEQYPSNLFYHDLQALVEDFYR